MAQPRDHSGLMTRALGTRLKRLGATPKAVAACAGLLALLTGAPALGQPNAESSEDHVSSSDFGGVGLLQTRTARFGPDGQLDVGASLVDEYRRYFINLHALPWLEATFRYTDVRNRLFSSSVAFSGEQTLKDRGADIKIRLMRESQYFPALAVGIQDGLGTGLFSSEYIVASKRYYDFDFSFGIAWGNAGSRGLWPNPMRIFSGLFDHRNSDSGRGGRPSFSDYFAGKSVSPFFGIEYRTPIRGLTAKLEFDGNDYTSEPLANRFDVDLPINFALNYRPFPWFDASIGLERGNSLMLRFAVRSDLNAPGLPKPFDRPPPPVGPRPGSEAESPAPLPEVPEADEALAMVLAPPLPTTAPVPAPGPDRPLGAAPFPGDPEAAVDRLFDGLELEGFEVASVELSHLEARVYLERGALNDDSLAVARAAQVVAEAVPSPVERITLVAEVAKGERKSVTFERGQVEEMAIVDYLFDGLEAQGFEVESLDLSHSEAKVYVSRGPSGGGHLADRRAARLVLRAVPMPVKQVRIITVAAGVERERVVLRREEMERSAAADSLFDGLEAAGFDLESVDISHRTTTVYIAAPGISGDADYRTAAEIVSYTVLEPMNEITVVGMHAGAEVRRWTLRRSSPDDTGTAAADLQVAEKSDAAAGPTASERAPEGIDNAALIEDLAKEGLETDAVHVTEQRVTVYITPTRFSEAARNIGRAARVVANHAPASVEEIGVVTLARGMELSRVTIMRRDLEAALASKGSPEEIWGNATLGPADGEIVDDAAPNPDRYPAFSWDIRPALRQHIGGPESFYLYQLFTSFSGRAEVMKGLSLTARFGVNMVDNFDRLRTPSDSKLPRVRSDIQKYLKEGKNNLINMHASYVFSPRPEWYARISAGIFEEMFGGVGAELLYRPFGARWAVGLDVNYVRQRDFDQLFDFRDYDVITGHLSLYYEMPWYNLLGMVQGGRYLAGDHGVTLTLSREFRSGMRVGAWTTFTDVSFDDFGEGSFDKGFFITIPFDALLLRSSRAQGLFSFRPLTRDGGQMVSVPDRLYFLTQEGSLRSVARYWSKFLD